MARGHPALIAATPRRGKQRALHVQRGSHAAFRPAPPARRTSPIPISHVLSPEKGRCILVRRSEGGTRGPNGQGTSMTVIRKVTTT